VLDAVKESQSRVKTMALLHEKLYQNNSLSSINMQEYLNQLGQFLNSTFRQDKDIQILVDAGNISLDVNTAVPIGLITNELLSNALKYAFSEQEEGEILLSLKPNATGGYELKVQDNGKGIDQEIDFKNLSSLGLKLVHTLTRQIQGSLNIKSEQGTTFAISFNDKLVAA
jgi:two-component sensor histidine kinase